MPLTGLTCPAATDFARAWSSTAIAASSTAWNPTRRADGGSTFLSSDDAGLALLDELTEGMSGRGDPVSFDPRQICAGAHSPPDLKTTSVREFRTNIRLSELNSVIRFLHAISAVIYARSSPDCPLSAEEQVASLRTIAADNGWLVAKVFIDRPTK